MTHGEIMTQRLEDLLDDFENLDLEPKAHLEVLERLASDVEIRIEAFKETHDELE